MYLLQRQGYDGKMESQWFKLSDLPRHKRHIREYEVNVIRKNRKRQGALKNIEQRSNVKGQKSCGKYLEGSSKRREKRSESKPFKVNMTN